MSQAFNFSSTSTSRVFPRLGVRLFVASLITGVNWYTQTRLAFAQRSKQNQIIKRVNDNKTVQKQQLENIAKLGQIQGCRVKVTGETGSNRFVIRRKRDGRDGYLVLAPFIINKTINSSQKYMLNLGWIPLESKPKIAGVSAFNPIGYDQLPDELAQDENAPALSTVTAFVRRGERRDILRGYNNWVADRLFKFIDLEYMEKIFGATDVGFRYLYLDRTSTQQGQQSFPFPQTNETYINQLKQQSDFNDKKRMIYSFVAGVASFGAAVLL